MHHRITEREEWLSHPFPDGQTEVLLARGCTQSKSLIGLGWPGGSKGPTPGSPATSPSMSSHLPLDKLVPIVAGEWPAKGERPQDVGQEGLGAASQARVVQNSQCFSPRGPCTHTQGQALETSGLAKFAQANHYPHCHLWWNHSRAAGLPSEPRNEDTDLHSDEEAPVCEGQEGLWTSSLALLQLLGSAVLSRTVLLFYLMILAFYLPVFWLTHWCPSTLQRWLMNFGVFFGDL